MGCGSASIRKLAMKFINPPTPHDQLILARTNGVLTTLCERAEPLGLTAACQMHIEDILVATVREDVLSRILQIRTKVTLFEETALTGKLRRDGGDSAFRASPEGGAAKHGTGSTTAASSVGAKGGDGTQNSGASIS
ncbi:hypothetical protein H4582DRAFT_2073742 [Lactarius indigo]|nr:hypothetical protein H4582DRAFT_2073742 [Lactarius indigo]